MDDEGVDRKLTELLERGNWNTTGDKSWETLLPKAGINKPTKGQRMTVRITQNDLDGIKLRAIEEGMPYQTLVTSVIHKYVTGRLTEKRG